MHAARFRNSASDPMRTRVVVVGIVHARLFIRINARYILLQILYCSAGATDPATGRRFYQTLCTYNVTL